MGFIMLDYKRNLYLILVSAFILSSCKDENGNYSVGVSLGGTGNGGISVGSGNPIPSPQPEVKPDRMEDDTEYAVAYPDPITQNCNDIERKIRFVSHYSPYVPLQNGDRQDLFGINSKSLPPIRFKLEVTIKNNSESKYYEYIDSCKAAFQLVGSKTEKMTSADYCLNDESVNEYQPHESRKFYYTFNLPNILQIWTVSYNAQYSKKFYGSSYEEDNLIERTQCNPLSTKLILDKYVSSRDDAPIIPNNVDDSNRNYSNADSLRVPPIFGGFDVEN